MQACALPWTSISEPASAAPRFWRELVMLRSEHAKAGQNIPPDMAVVVSEGAKEFHVAGCEFIHNRDKIRTLTAKEAIREGYVPCVRCMRKYLQIASAARQAEDSEADLEQSIDEDDPRGQ